MQQNPCSTPKVLRLFEGMEFQLNQRWLKPASSKQKLYTVTSDHLLFRRLLFRTKDLSQVKHYCRSFWTRMLEEKVSPQDFIFAKEVRLGTYRYFIYNLFRYRQTDSLLERERPSDTRSERRSSTQKSWSIRWTPIWRTGALRNFKGRSQCKTLWACCSAWGVTKRWVRATIYMIISYIL